MDRVPRCPRDWPSGAAPRWLVSPTNNGPGRPPSAGPNLPAWPVSGCTRHAWTWARVPSWWRSWRFRRSGAAAGGTLAAARPGVVPRPPASRCAGHAAPGAGALGRRTGCRPRPGAPVARGLVQAQSDSLDASPPRPPGGPPPTSPVAPAEEPTTTTSTTQTAAAHGRPHADRGIVERDHELRIIQQALGEAQRDDGRVVLIEGPAGIGKTHLLREIRHRAGTATVLNARGSTLEKEYGFGVVRQLFEPVLATRDKRNCSPAPPGPRDRSSSPCRNPAPPPSATPHSVCCTGCTGSPPSWRRRRPSSSPSTTSVVRRRGADSWDSWRTTRGTPIAWWSRCGPVSTT